MCKHYMPSIIAIFLAITYKYIAVVFLITKSIFSKEVSCDS